MNNIALITDSNYKFTKNDEVESFTLDYMKPFLLDDSTSMIANVITTGAILKSGCMFFPVTINNEEYDNSYVCSPYTACVSYAQEEMDKLNNKLLEIVLGGISQTLGLFLKKAKINQVVCVNNWMLSTNLYPLWNGADIPEICDYFTKEFPEHALVFRSLNEHSNAELLNSLKSNRFIIVPSRQVYIFDRDISPFTTRNNTQIDIKTLKKTEYEIINHGDLKESDYLRIVELYNLLYLEKYSKHNPQFTKGCVAYWHKKKLLTMIGLRNKEGMLDGIIGFFEMDGITSAPLVGYDTNIHKQKAIYRMLMALAIGRANDEGLILNLSSGAAEFKRLRGGQPFIEYSAVYINHLPMGKRLVWRLTNLLLTYLGVPIMKVFKL